MTEQAPRFRFHRPAERLRSCISAYFFADFSSGQPVDVLMYPEWAHIRIALTGVWSIQIGDTVSSSPVNWSVISGPTSVGVRVHAEPPATTVSIGLLPLGWARLIRRSAALHADRLDPLASVFPEQATTLRQAVIEAGSDEAVGAVLDKFFLELEAADTASVSPLLPRMHELIRDPATRTVEQLAEALGRSDRQLARLSRDVFGFSPKLLLRRQRFVRSLLALHENPGLPWKSLTDPGYHDHSHFVRDFHQFMGMSPSRFQALSRLHVDRVAQVRMLQLGVPHQTLQAGAPPDE